MAKPRLLALALLAAPMISAPLSHAQNAPVLGSYFEIEAHRVAGETSFRSPDAPRGSSSTLVLDIVIDEQGNVVTVRPSPDSSRGDIRRWYRRASVLVRQWRFRPFLREGRPVRVQFRAQVDVLPPVRTPRHHRRFPNVPLDQIAISLIRGGCYGFCPTYSVTIRGDGRVRFEGIAHTLVEGVREATVPVACVERLVARFRAADFWSLDNRYRSDVTDSPEYVLTVTAGRRTKTVADYVGIEVGMPEVVTTLEEAVDATAGTARWVDGTLPDRANSCDEVADR
jgi:hypothetical protein